MEKFLSEDEDNIVAVHCLVRQFLEPKMNYLPHYSADLFRCALFFFFFFPCALIRLAVDEREPLSHAY